MDYTIYLLREIALLQKIGRVLVALYTLLLRMYTWYCMYGRDLLLVALYDRALELSMLQPPTIAINYETIFTSLKYYEYLYL